MQQRGTRYSGDVAYSIEAGRMVDVEYPIYIIIVIREGTRRDSGSSVMHASLHPLH